VSERADQIRSNAAEEESRIAELNSTLGQQRTPYLKGQLQQAMSKVTDVETLLRFAQQSEPRHAGAWMSIAEENIKMAANIREQVQKVVDAYGGPDNVEEFEGS